MRRSVGLKFDPGASLYANSTLVFTGTIEGCGTGNIAMRSTGRNRGGVTSGEIDGHADPSGSGSSSGHIDLAITC